MLSLKGFINVIMNVNLNIFHKFQVVILRFKYNNLMQITESTVSVGHFFHNSVFHNKINI